MRLRSSTPWPDHWNYDKDSIKCLVDGCEYTTRSKGLNKQFEDLETHCADTLGIEHVIFSNMLRQRSCPRCCYRASGGQTNSKKIRNLFAHEKVVHNSVSMSCIRGYIVLARKGRIAGPRGQESQKIAFDRMIEKLQGFDQPITHLLCQKGGLPHSNSNLQHILSTDDLRHEGHDTPFWWPVPAERFLWLLRPDDDDPSDYQWGRVWVRLRQMYRNGHL